MKMIERLCRNKNVLAAIKTEEKLLDFHVNLRIIGKLGLNMAAELAHFHRGSASGTESGPISAMNDQKDTRKESLKHANDPWPILEFHQSQDSWTDFVNIDSIWS